MSDQPSLAGPIARINRLHAALNAFLRSSPYDVEVISDSDEQTRACVLQKLHDVPALHGPIAGEAVHHLPSAFDLLTHDLLVKHGVSNPKRLCDCAFPMITNLDLANPSDRKKYDESGKA